MSVDCAYFYCIDPARCPEEGCVWARDAHDPAVERMASQLPEPYGDSLLHAVRYSVENDRPKLFRPMSPRNAHACTQAEPPFHQG